jgi:hypothetical protein
MSNKKVPLATNQLFASNIKRKLTTESPFHNFVIHMNLSFSVMKTKSKPSIPPTDYPQFQPYDSCSSDEELDLEDSIHLTKVRFCKARLLTHSTDDIKGSTADRRPDKGRNICQRKDLDLKALKE